MYYCALLVTLAIMYVHIKPTTIPQLLADTFAEKWAKNNVKTIIPEGIIPY